MKQPKRYLSGPQVDARYNINRVTRWRWTNNPAMNFPQPIYPTPNTPRWAEDELDAFDARLRGSAA